MSHQSRCLVCWAMNTLIRTLTIGLLAPLIWTAPSLAGAVTPRILNTRCTIEGTTVRLKKVTYTCTKTGKTLRWKTAPAAVATTTTTLPFGYPFVMPDQYVQGNTKANVAVSRTTLKRGESIQVSVKITAQMMGETYEDDWTSTLQQITDKCKSEIGKGQEFAPVPGWETRVEVGLLGTSVTAGGSTTLTIYGNVPTACGTSLLPSEAGRRPRISVTRISVYKDVPLTLTVPATLAAGNYDLLLSPLGSGSWSSRTPIRITVTD